MKRLLFIVGSFHENGFNYQLAKQVERSIGDRAYVDYLDYSTIPFFRQEDMYPCPPDVEDVRKKIDDVDALWVFTPEYNGSYPGVVKNLFDWLSISLDPHNSRGESIIHAKKTAVAGIGGNTAARAREEMGVLLDFIRTYVCHDAGFGITPRREEWATGLIEFSEETQRDIHKHVDIFLDFLDEG
ncbi:MAG: NAD(P)H-dependent oxidoreductase [Actinomycetaceae bacterium]|nr:NAD(P)H-dependent oxidoreductase [Actinomycetaceae bacterium]